MYPRGLWRLSLKSRVTLFTLLIFLLGTWGLAWYATRMLGAEQQQLLGQQQFANVSLVADQINVALGSRLKALETVAGRSGPAMQAGPAALQSWLEQNVLLADLFNLGVLAYDTDGTVLAEWPLRAGRAGLIELHKATVLAALAQGKSSVSDVYMGDELQSPVFGMTAPVRNTQGQVIGAISGVIDLGKPNFLNHVMRSPYGKTGAYLLIAPRQRLVITATDKSRIMAQLPLAGVSAALDQLINGHEGSAVFVDPHGVEMLMSDVGVASVGWVLAAVLPTQEAFAPIRTLQQRLLLAALALTLLASALTWWMLRRQLAPMAGSGQAAQAQPIAHREAALTQSTQQYRQLVNDLQVGVLIHSPGSEVLMSNQLALDLLGLTLDQLLGKTSLDPSWDVIHEDGSPFPGHRHPVSQVIATGQAVEGAVMGVFRPISQDRVWLLVTAKPQFNPDGKLQQVVCTFSNISQRKLAEARLEKSEAFKNTVLNSLKAGIAVVDRIGIIQAVNPAWQGFVQENSDTSAMPAPLPGMGGNCLAVCDGPVRSGIAAVLTGALPQFALEYPCNSLSQRRWFAMTVVPLGKDVQDGAVITQTDISAIKQATENEQHRNHILELLAGDQALGTILEALVLGVEQLQLGALCSILLLSSDGRHLERGVAPSLPDFYNAALDGVEIGVGVGSCGTAAYTGELVVVADIATHPYWVPYKDLAARAGLGACWSQPFRDSRGRVLGTFAIYHGEAHTPQAPDIALIEQSAHLASIAVEKHLATEKLRNSEAHFRLLTEQVSDVIWRQDSNNVFTYISPADERLRGFRAEEVLGQHISAILTEEGTQLVKVLRQQRREAEENGNLSGPRTVELQQRCKDGRLIWTEVVSTPERDAKGAIIGYYGVTREITERKNMQDQVRQLAFFDPLTLLPNRRMLDDRLKQTMAASNRSRHYGALMFLDLDNFKPLNDAHGHETGDLLLVEVAQRLLACVREVDTVARIGGDEFVVMLSDLTVQLKESVAQALSVAEKIRWSLAQPYVLVMDHQGLTAKTVAHRCSVSIGVAMFVDHEHRQADILHWADMAMYQAKDAGRNQVCVHTQESGGAV